MAKIITFHARSSKDKPNPTHTLAFMPQGDGTLLCTYSKPHPGLESYCKATGNRIVENRMAAMVKELDTEALGAYQTTADMPKVFDNSKRFVPACVRRTLKYYTGCAKKYFKIENPNPVIIVRGLRPDWEEWMEGGQETKVPVKSVLFSKRYEAL